MSTSYYRLQQPFTSIRLEESIGPHDKVTVWENGANCGTLVLTRGFGRRVVRLFSETEYDDSRCPLRTHFGGSATGTMVTVNDRDLPDSATVIDEYGRPFKVFEVKAMSGAGKE